MYKKYTLPMSIFIVFENLNLVLWTSEKFQPNSFIIFLNQSWLLTVNIFFKKDVFLSNSSLIENSALDLKQNLWFLKNQTDFKKSNLIFYIYYFFSVKVKIMLLCVYNFKKKILSLDKLYKSSNWLERETSEMFCVLFKNKIDCRRLLLDYSKQENPLLKDFPVEGFYDVFYCFFENQVINISSNVIEL